MVTKIKFTMLLKFISVALTPYTMFLLLFKINLLEMRQVLMDLLLKSSFPQ